MRRFAGASLCLQVPTKNDENKQQPIVVGYVVKSLMHFVLVDMEFCSVCSIVSVVGDSFVW